jgi:hypothetical protein
MAIQVLMLSNEITLNFVLCSSFKGYMEAEIKIQLVMMNKMKKL